MFEQVFYTSEQIFQRKVSGRVTRKFLGICSLKNLTHLVEDFFRGVPLAQNGEDFVTGKGFRSFMIDNSSDSFTYGSSGGAKKT